MQARRSATFVGVGSGAIGIALGIAPRRANAFLGLHSEAAIRAIGLADAVLAPGLIWGEPRGAYVVGRAALNLGIAGYLMRSRTQSRYPRRPTAASLALAAVTTADTRMALTLGRTRS